MSKFQVRICQGNQSMIATDVATFSDVERVYADCYVRSVFKENGVASHTGFVGDYIFAYDADGKIMYTVVIKRLA